jgi:hypothetical protein
MTALVYFLNLRTVVRYYSVLCRPEFVYMNGWFQMQGGKNRILPKEMNANRFFWDSHWLEIWSNHFCLSMGPNGGRVAMDSGGRGFHTIVSRVRSHAPSIRSHRGTKVVWPDFQRMRVPEELDCIDLFRQNPVFTSLHLKYPVHVVSPPGILKMP